MPRNMFLFNNATTHSSVWQQVYGIVKKEHIARHRNLSSRFGEKKVTKSRVKVTKSVTKSRKKVIKSKTLTLDLDTLTPTMTLDLDTLAPT